MLEKITKLTEDETVLRNELNTAGLQEADGYDDMKEPDVLQKLILDKMADKTTNPTGSAGEKMAQKAMAGFILKQ